MKNVLKLGAVVLAIVMVLSMSVTAFANSATLTDGVAGSVDNNTATALAKTVLINKAIKAFNPNETSIGAPTITYNYAIVAVTGVNATITNANTTVNVKDGIEGASVTSSLSWAASEDLTASQSGTDNTKTITADFTGVSFPGAGVYRYAITETIASSAYTASGVTDGTPNATDDSRTETLYLDVYVRDAADQGETGCQIYGYVLSSANSNKTTSSTDKLDHFTTDAYHTSNVIVSKTLVGDAQNNNHGFPFSIKFENSSVTANVKLKRAVNSAAASDMTAGTLSSRTDYQLIAHNGTVKYIGVPTGTTVTAYETNNVTGTVYKSAATVPTGGTAAAEKSISWGSAPGQYTDYATQDYNSNYAAATTAQDTDFTEAFTNTLQLISPTGVALRVAPYALMLGVGLFLVLFSRRRKNQAEA